MALRTTPKAYDAFISYQRTADLRVAEGLQSGLHHFARPFFRLRALHVYRDRTDLSPNPALGDTLRAALDRSRFFILLASPESAASPWVQAEIRHWLTIDPHARRMLIVVTGGAIVWGSGSEPDWNSTTALPGSVLANVFEAEPAWIDLRWARTADDLTLRHADFRDTVAEIAAPLHGREKSELAGEDVRRAKQLKWAAALGIVVVATIAAAGLRQQSLARARAAEAARERVSRTVAGLVQSDPTTAAIVLGSIPLSLLGENGLPLALQALSEPLATILRGPASPVAHLQFSPDGARLAILRADGSLHVWRADGRGDAGVVKERGAGAAAFSRDGRTMLVANHHGAAEVLRTADWTVALSTPGYKGRVRSAAFAPDGTRALVAVDDGTVRVFRTDGSRPIVVVKPRSGVFDAAFTQDSRRLLVVPFDGPPELWDAERGERISAGRRRLEGRIEGAAFGLTGDCIVTRGRFDTAAEVWRAGPHGGLAATTLTVSVHVEPGDAERALSGAAVIAAVAVTPDCRTIAAADGAGTVRVDYGDRAASTYQDEHGGVRHLALSTVRGRVAVSGDSNARLWSDDRFDVRVLRGHAAEIDAIAFSPDAAVVATGSADGSVRLWRAAGTGVPQLLRGAVVESESGDGSTSWGRIDFSADGERLLTQDHYGSGTIWSRDGRESSRIEGTFPLLDALIASADAPRLFLHEDVRAGIRASGAGRREALLREDTRGYGRLLDASRDGSRLLVSTATESDLELWEVDTSDTGNRLGVASATSAAFSADGRSYAVGTGTGEIHAWLSGRDAPVRLQANEGEVLSVSFDAGGTRLVSGGPACSVHVWDLRSREPAEIWRADPRCDGDPGRADGVVAVAFSPYGSSVAAGIRRVDRTIAEKWANAGRTRQAEGIVALWPLGVGGSAVFLRLPWAVLDVAFSPDGQRLAASSEDGHVRIWPLRWSDVHGTLQRVVATCATVEQRKGLLGETEAEATAAWEECERGFGRRAKSS